MGGICSSGQSLDEQDTCSPMIVIQGGLPYDCNSYSTGGNYVELKDLSNYSVHQVPQRVTGSLRIKGSAGDANPIVASWVLAKQGTTRPRRVLLCDASDRTFLFV